jgi:hypothetical protein
MPSFHPSNESRTERHDMASIKMIGIDAAASFLVALAFAAPAKAWWITPSGREVPDAKITNPDGSERRFYTTGPMGTRTYRIDVSPSGEILSRTQVLTPETFAGIVPGAQASEVLALIGPPHQKIHFSLSNTTSWDYHFSDSFHHGTDFSVIFDAAGVVVGKFTQHEES